MKSWGSLFWKRTVRQQPSEGSKSFFRPFPKTQFSTRLEQNDLRRALFAQRPPPSSHSWKPELVLACGSDALGPILHPSRYASQFLALGSSPITYLCPCLVSPCPALASGLAFLVCPGVPRGSPAGLEGAPPGGAPSPCPLFASLFSSLLPLAHVRLLLSPGVEAKCGWLSCGVLGTPY